jgi:hypothetical protein
MVSSDSPLVIYDPHPHITLFQVNLKAPLNRQARLPRIGRTENDFQKIQATRRDSLMHQQPMQVPGMIVTSMLLFGFLLAPDSSVTARTHALI